jgi:putative Holliday junction resolvase
MPRILGIDYGIKKCGIAVSDPLQIIVSPLKTVKTSSMMSFLKIYLSEEEVEKVVFGLPTHADGNPTYLVAEIESFAKKLLETYPELVLAYQNENYTSAQAQQIILTSGLTKKQRQDKSRLDKISAVLILQRYLKHI